MWSPLKGSGFDLCDSSMSAAVQELYAGLPAALSAKCSVLSDPTLVLDAEPEAPAFVLSCSSGLPSEHQRTYELKLCSPDSHESSDYVGQMPGPTLVEILSREPAGTVVLAGNEETQDGSSAEQESLSGQLREDAEAAKSPRGVVEEGLSCFAPALEAACWSKEAEPRLIQEGRECLPRPFHAERAGSLQSLEESQANSQVAAENPMKEAPGRKANRTVLFGKAGASSPHVSPGVPPGTRECSEVEAFMAEVEVSETSTLVSLEPFTVVDDALAKERLRGEEECQRPKAATASALSVSEAGREKLLNQDQECGAALGHILPSHQEKMNLYDNSSPASDLENRDTLPSGTVSQMSNCQLFQGGLELGCILWEEEMDVIEVVCETQEESPLGDERCSGDAAPCAKTPLLETWASLMSTGRSPLATYSGMEQSRDSDTEQEVGKRTDHSYSCAWEGNADVEKDNAMQSYWKETQAGSCSENCPQELQVCQFSKEQNTHSETDTSCRLGVGHSSPEGHSDDDLESTISGSDSVQRNHVQQYSLPKDGNLASALEGSASPGEKAGNSVCFPSGCTVSTFSLPACRVPFSWDRRSCEEPLQPVESASSQRTLISSSATSLHGVHSPGTAGVHLVSREEILPIAQHSVAHSFPPGSGMISSPAGFLDSLPKEELSGTCAELGRQGAACLLCNEKAGPNCGGCTDGSRESQQCAAPGLCTMEERMVGTPTVESNKCSPTDQRVNGPCSAAKHDWIILESVCLDDHVLKMRTETTTEHVGGLETCHPLVHTKIAGPLLERSGFEAQDSPSYQNNQRDLDGAENNSASLCSMLIGSTALSGDEVLALDANVEGEKKANDRNAEEILDVDTHFGPPDTNLEQGLIAVSLVAGPGRTEAEESGKGKEDNHRNGANEKPRDCGRMGETVHRSELGRLVKGQGKEDEVPVHHPDHLYSTCSWNREVETPEREVLKDQQHLSMISSWPARDGAAQAVTCSETQKSPSCSQNEFLGLQSNGIVTPQPAPVLVTPNDTQQNMTVSCFSNETASESVSDPLEGEPVELKNSEPHLECVSEWKEWTDEVKIGNFCSASQSVEASPADVQEEMHSLMLFKSESASPSDQTYLHRALFAGANGQNSIEGGSSGMCQNQKLSSPTCIILGAQPAQNPGTSLSRKDDPSISLYPSVLCYPPTPRYPVPTRSEGDHHVRSLTSGDEKGSHSPQVGSCVGSPPHSKEVPRSMIGSNAGIVIGGEIVCTTPSNVNLSRKMAPSLEVHLRGSSQEARKVDLPFGSNAVDSSGPSSQCLKQAAGEGVPVLPEAEACPRLPFNSSELGLSNEPPCVKDTRKIVTLMGSEDDSEDAGGHAWHSKGLLPIGSPGVLRSGVPWASPGGMSEASPKCFRSHERHRQCTERSREQAGVKRKSSSHLFSRGIEVPVWITRVSEMGDRPELAAKALRKEAGGCPYRSFDGLRAKPKGDHRMKSSVGQPLCGPAEKPEAPARQAFAVGRITEGRKSKSAWSTLQESKRPKISKDSVELDCLEAGSSRLSEKNCGWTSTDSNAPLAPVFNKQTPAVGSLWDRIGNAFGSAHKTRPSLASSRPPRKVWGKRSGLVQFKAARKSTPVRSSACLKSLLEVVPLPQSKRVDRASSAVWRWAPKSRASRNRLLDSVGFGRLAKDQAFLRRLSLLADKLLAPPRNPRHLKPPSHSTKLLPLTGHCRWLSSQKLLDIFSCVNLPLNSWGMNDSNRSLKTLSSPPLTLFLVESLDLCFWDLGHQAPLSVSTPLVPILFHMKVGLFPGRSLLGITSLQNQVVMGKRDATVKSWSWMLSFLFPGSRLSAAPVEEGAWTPTDSSLCAEKDRREDTTVQRSTGLPIHGLQTILALSSPRCHRLWMKKQPLSARRTLATQKLTMLQFIQGLKGSNCSSPATADFSSSVSHSLGRGLSLWSQHSPSTRPFEFPPLCSNHYTWPPVTPAASSLGIRNRITPDTSAASFHFANVQQRSGLKTPGPGCNPQFHLNQSPRLQFSAPLLKNNPHGKHPAMLLQVPDRIFGAPWFVASAVKVEPPLPASLLTPCLDSEPALSSLGLSTSEFQVRPLDGLDISLPVLPKTGSHSDKADSEKKPKKVSQIRIRKTIPKPDPNLTPMGLPRPKRLKKKEFSLEEIYTNKNYKSPPTTRCLETIFEEPKEKNGSLISVSQQKRKRILEFQDFTIPRKRRVRSRVKVLGSFTRAQKAALEGRELDVLLIQKLTDLETFFAKEEEKEQAASS